MNRGRIAKKRKREENTHATSKTVKGIFKKDDLDDSLSTSDWDMVIDETYQKSKTSHSNPKWKNKLFLRCEWNGCPQSLTDYDQFVTNHLKSHLDDYSPLIDKDSPYKCYWTNCSSHFTSLPELSRHLVYHGYHAKLTNLGENAEAAGDLPECTQTEKFVFPDNADWYDCQWDDCDQKFWTIYEFFVHMKWHMFQNHQDPATKKFLCLWKGCTTKVSAQYRLTEHINIHTKEKMLACPTCGHHFANKTKFYDHRTRQVPTTMRSYFCSQCSKFFANERLLKDHMRLHINQYKCTMCDMTCPKPSNLALHIRNRHLDVKPFKCPKCDYSCVEKHNMDKHLKKHDPEKQYGCEDCDFKCRASFTLDKHYQKKHDQGRANIYECQVCKKRFKRGGVLTKHLMKVHKYHWPSGHVRFRYKEDSDNIHRLQTVRYETLDVTEEIIKGQKMELPSGDIEFNVIPAEDDRGVKRYNIVFSDESQKKISEETAAASATTVIITIDDVDSRGNVVKSKTIQGEIVCSDLKEMPSDQDIRLDDVLTD